MGLHQPRIHLSGGPHNQASNVSWGGKVSLAVDSGVGPQKMVWDTVPMAGVTLCEGYGIPLGAATLTYTSGNGVLKFVASDSSILLTFLGSDGVYHVGNNTSYFIVSVITALLPLGDTTVNMDVLPFKNNIFDDVLNTERSSGKTEYRCLYLKNEDTTDITNVTLSVANPALGYMKIAKEYVFSGNVTGLPHPRGFSYLRGFSGTHPYFFKSKAWVANPPPQLHYFRTLYISNQEEDPDVQSSDGSVRDISTDAGGETDPNGATCNLTFTTSVSWPIIKAGRYVSFWLQRLVPYASTGSLIHDVSSLNLIYSL